MTRVDEGGLTPREADLLRRLSPPWRIQRFLDRVAYDATGEACRSPRRVLRERKAQCLDGAIFAAAALRLQGHRPLLVDLQAEQDDDHVLAVFQIDGAWGAIARSNYAGLRYREPVHRSLRELAMSYFDAYFNLRRQRTLRRVSRPVDLRRFDARGWMSTEDDLGWLGDVVDKVPHQELLTRSQEQRLSTVDRRAFEAGLVGREGH